MARLTGLLYLAMPLLLATALFHCDRGAIAEEVCKQIEEKRCSASIGCPGIGIETERDVIECQLFYQDQCLFGIASDATRPDDAAAAACIAAIEKLEACKGSPSLAECAEVPALSAEVALDTTTACDVIHKPELLEDCGFLRAVPQPAAGGAGGEGGTGGGGTGGTGGSGGTGGTGG